MKTEVPAARRPRSVWGRAANARWLPVWDKLRLQGVGQCGAGPCGPHMAQPAGTAVGNWSRLSASAGGAGACPWWRGRDSRCHGRLRGEDKLSLREPTLWQVGWDSVNTHMLRFSPCLGHLVPSPFPSYS